MVKKRFKEKCLSVYHYYMTLAIYSYQLSENQGMAALFL